MECRVPGEVGSVAGRPSALRDPVVEPYAPVFVLPGLVEHVGQRVHRMARGWLAGQCALGKERGFVVAALVLADEGEQRDVPPVVDVRRGQALDQLPGLPLYVGDAGER